MEINIDKDLFAFGDNNIINIVFFSSGDFGIPTLKLFMRHLMRIVKPIILLKV